MTQGVWTTGQEADRSLAMSGEQLAEEQRELVIPLGIELDGEEVGQALRQRFWHAVAPHLDRAAVEGWVPREAVDWDGALRAGRIAVRMRSSCLGLLGYYELVSMRVRVSRCTSSADATSD